jgi:hypothetical protein
MDYQVLKQHMIKNKGEELKALLLNSNYNANFSELIDQYMDEAYEEITTQNSSKVDIIKPNTRSASASVNFKKDEQIEQKF